MKILSPAGNMESLKAAVYNGADEVYLGVNEFNARNNIDGFSMQTLKDAVDFAHVYGVKVCLAVNILFSGFEVEKALELIVSAYNVGVDAFIIQDLGLISIIHKNYPFMEIHASTQMGIHNLEGVKFLENYGIKRVVLSRETPLSEIKRIRQNSSVEIEYFVHGALCVSFSGNCYMSSYFFDASGNRGRCKQLCRLPFTLIKEGKRVKTGHLLSAKDFNMIKRLKDLAHAGVDVLKIEGRARRPFYVATATKEYYNALNSKPYSQDNLSLAFNRGYTEGYFNGNDNLISKLNNHVGIEIGVVERVNKGKTFNEVFFTSSRPLCAKSTFKFFVAGKEKCTVSAFDLTKTSSGKYRLTTTAEVPNNSTVNIIVDYDIERQVLEKTTKRKVPVKMVFKKGMPMLLEFTVFDKTYTVTGDVLEGAKKQPLTQEEIIQNFRKSEDFDCEIVSIDLQKVFAPKQQLNNFRRNVLDAIYSAITEKYKKSVSVVKIKSACGKSFTEYQFVTDIDQAFTQKNIIYSPEEYTLYNVQKFCDKCISLKKTPYLDTPNFALESDIILLKEIIEKTKIGVVANNYYALSFDTKKVIGGGLNVYNAYSAESLGFPVITAESDLYSKQKFAYMTLRHCPIKEHVGGDCNNCKYSDGYVYAIDDGRKMKLKRKKISTCTFYLVD